MRRFAGMALAALWAGACTCATPVGQLRFTCHADAECGTGYVCRADECVPESAAPPVDAGSSDGGPSPSDAGCGASPDCSDPACAGTACGLNGLACNGSACACSGNGGSAQAKETVCDDGADNDCNGLADCAEAYCDQVACGKFGQRCAGGVCTCSGNGGLAQTTESVCNDGKDNDCDGLIDCADPSCAARPCSTSGWVCTAGACACAVDGGPFEPIEASCGDGVDNDCNGAIDCQDSACNTKACGPFGRVCTGTTCLCSGNGGPRQTVEMSCGDGFDNDCDGLVDCADSDCTGASCGTYGRSCSGGVCSCSGNGGAAELTEVSCGDGKDNDCNGAVDCLDAACAGQACGANGRQCSGPSCLCAGNGGTPQPYEYSCDDGFDNDCDGFTDCADSNCTGAVCGTFGKYCAFGGGCACQGNGGPAEATETSCGDGRDNDCDGLVDCADPDCLGRQCSTIAGYACLSPTLCGCATYDTPVDTARHGRGSAVAFDGGVALLYNNVATAGGIYFTQCESGCAGPAPAFSTPINLYPTNAYLALRPVMLSTGGASLAALWRDSNGNGPLTYAECAGGCADAGAWSQAPIGGGLVIAGTAAGLAVLGPLHAAVARSTAPNAQNYGECTAGCASASGAWTFVSIPSGAPTGGAVALSDDGDGGVRRSAVFGATGAPGMWFGECSSGCANSSANWTTVQLVAGTYPALVIDSAGLPRVFSQGATGTALQLTRCTQRPCGLSANWATTTLMASSSFVTAGVTADGRTFFLTSNGATATSQLMVGVENAPPAVGYTTKAIAGCGANFVGEAPSGWLGPGDRVRAGYDDGAGMSFLFQPP